jgi:subtilisin family serine protease
MKTLPLIAGATALLTVALGITSAAADPTTSWGLDRIDSIVVDGNYNYPAVAGSKVRIYIVDTGIQANHPDFQGRILSGYDALGTTKGLVDCSGHGTGVAGIAAGTIYGVAKKATLIPVKVMDCNGSGSFSNAILGLTWILNNNPKGQPAVVNLSISGPKNAALDDAINKLIASGITVVGAAGNAMADACNSSPASNPNVLTVGSTNKNDYRTNTSSYGECVDIYAPGGLVPTDNATDFTKTDTPVGSSVATPIVTGVAALYLSLHPAAKPAEVISAIRGGGLKGVVVDSRSINGNILVNSKFMLQ